MNILDTILKAPTLKRDINNKFLIWVTETFNKIITFSKSIDLQVTQNKTDIKNNSNEIGKLDTRVTTLENSGGSSGINFNKATIYYNITPWNAGTSTDNECQSFVEGKFLPINVIPYELTTSTWRTYYITKWNYIEPTTEHPTGQTQILYYASDTQSPIDLVGLQCD